LYQQTNFKEKLHAVPAVNWQLVANLQGTVPCQKDLAQFVEV
jgi:hypothetical protein